MRSAFNKSFAAALLALAFATPPAQATHFTVSGHVYDITTQATNFATSPSLFQSNPWWHNSPLAITFAGVVADALGMPNAGGAYGAFFGFQDYVDPNDPNNTGGTSAMFSGVYEVGPSQTGAHDFSPSLAGLWTYAFATEVITTPPPNPVPGGGNTQNNVPEPGTLALLGLTLGVASLRSLRRRTAA